MHCLWLTLADPDPATNGQLLYTNGSGILGWVSGATPSDSGLASGLINTSVQVGGAIGLAVLATLASERTDVLRASGHSADAALNGGFHLAYLIGAALVGVAIVVALSVLRSGSPAAAAHQAEPHAESRRAKPAYSDAC